MRFTNKVFKTYALLIYAFLYVPLIVLVAFSFSSNNIVAWPFGDFSLRWYGALMENEQVKTSLVNTLFVGLVAAVLATGIGTVSVHAVMRYLDRRIAFMILAFLVFPELLPDMVKGIAQLMFFVQWGISLSLWTVIVGHVVFCLPYVALLTASRSVSFDVSLEEASMDLGAGRFETFRYVTLPMFMPAIFGSLVFTFTLSINDYLVTTFITGPEPLLPIVFWGMVRFGIKPLINAVSTVIFVISLLAGMIGFYWVSRMGKRIPFL